MLTYLELHQLLCECGQAAATGSAINADQRQWAVMARTVHRMADGNAHALLPHIDVADLRAAITEPSGRWTLDNQGDPNDPSDAPFTGATWAPNESNRPGLDWIVRVDADGDLEDLQQRGGGSKITCDGDHLHTASDIIPLDPLFAWMAASPDVDVEELVARMRRAQSDYDDSGGEVPR